MAHLLVIQKVHSAIHKLEERQCAVLKSLGMERIFDGLRAACCIPFHFDEYAYAACIIGEGPSKLRHFAMRLPLHCLQLIGMLRTAFTEWEAHQIQSGGMPRFTAHFKVKMAGRWGDHGLTWSVLHWDQCRSVDPYH